MNVEQFPPVRRVGQDLTKVAAFKLGPLTIDPPDRSVSNGDLKETIEPRVMRVLVALSEVPGTVISRDDLIDLAWDGLIVGENAIKKPIWRLRHVLDELSDGAVRLETITKVGFRIIVAAHAEPDKLAAEVTSTAGVSGIAETDGNDDEPKARKWPRRAAIAGLIGIGACSAVGYRAWRFAGDYIPNPRAFELYTRGMMLRRSASPEATLQAVTYFKQAVEIDPEFAAAWGALAIAYSWGKYTFGASGASLPASPTMVRSAAERALALDPDQAEGQLSLVLIDPEFWHWRDTERKLRAVVASHPDHPLANGMFGLFLADVGRSEEAVNVFRHMLDVLPMVPFGWSLYATTLHSAGRNVEADAALDEGLSRFPAHQMLWRARYDILLGTERHKEAAAFARDPRTLPPMMPMENQRFLQAVADALSTGQGGDSIIEDLQQRMGKDDALIPGAAFFFAMLGAASPMFEALERHYLARLSGGRKIPTPAIPRMFLTRMLFVPSIRAYHADTRFEALLQGTRLEDYWRQSGRLPDFRRA